MMNMASAAARYWPDASAAITATQIARSAEILRCSSPEIGGEERAIAGDQRQDGRRIDAGDGSESAGDVQQ